MFALENVSFLKIAMFNFFATHVFTAYHNIIKFLHKAFLVKKDSSLLNWKVTTFSNGEIVASLRKYIDVC